MEEKGQKEFSTDGRNIVNELFLANSVDGLVGNQQTLVDVARKMVGDKEAMSFTVTHKTVNPEPPVMPPRKESPRRNHTINDIEGFAKYIEEYKTEKTVILVDIESRKARAILNEEASHGFEIINFEPVIHPLFHPWSVMMLSDIKDDSPALKEVVGLRASAFANFIQTNRRAIVEPDGQELARLLAQIKISKKIEIQHGTGPHSINGIVCEMDIGGLKKNEIVDIPETLNIEVPLFVGTDPVKLEIDLLVGTADGPECERLEVTIKMLSADVDLKIYEAFSSMLNGINRIDGVIVAIGSDNYLEWDYLQPVKPVR